MPSLSATVSSNLKLLIWSQFWNGILKTGEWGPNGGPITIVGSELIKDLVWSQLFNSKFGIQPTYVSHLELHQSLLVLAGFWGIWHKTVWILNSFNRVSTLSFFWTNAFRWKTDSQNVKFDVQTLWSQPATTVIDISWHPTKEGLLVKSDWLGVFFCSKTVFLIAFITYRLSALITVRLDFSKLCLKTSLSSFHLTITKKKFINYSGVHQLRVTIRNLKPASPCFPSVTLS